MLCTCLHIVVARQREGERNSTCNGLHQRETERERESEREKERERERETKPLFLWARQKMLGSSAVELSIEPTRVPMDARERE
jgi:hypothetical protein